ncbi:rhodanese-related sulfurtransferase [Buchnera aphidicola]|uniref:oxygen-dependent tRNA uridine(34) hydroxylase TrhO n=1 Tax=Buchnera aphidicola TaxID=9 RepID=UPI0031B85A7F
MKNLINLSFYKYISIIFVKEFRNILYIYFSKLNIHGRIYISNEGINAQISIYKKNFFKFKKILNFFFNNIYLNKSIDTKRSFSFLNIKIKKKILSDGFINYFKKEKNLNLSIQDVNIMLKKNIIIIDMRNKYEYDIGHFNKAFIIPSFTFREQLKKIVHFFCYAKNDPILIYCTGGIRCERASLFMKNYGYKKIYQIKGGIIKYVYDAKKKNLPMLFQGKNFVFDERISELNTKIIKSTCRQCYFICDYYVNCKNVFCNKLFIQCFKCFIKFNGCCSLYCKNQI